MFADDDEMTQQVARSLEPPRTGLVARVVEGPDGGLEARVGPLGTLSVGTAEGNELRLSNSTVSRYHVEIAATAEGIHVRDLGSVNGTMLGEIRLESAHVPEGARLRLGTTVITLGEVEEQSLEGASPRPAPIEGLVAESPAMRRIVETLRKLAPTRVSTLLMGETGTGKEVIARALHACSDRSASPFEVVDCGSLAPTLVASELFGHEKGAFTGAGRRHIGAFERAHGGTIFLDEIGELPLELQPALLGVLERQRFHRVGGDRPIEVDVRVVSATHRDLRAAANAESFRADLYFRLAVTRIVIPPLRERVEDILPLTRHFAEQLLGEPGPLPFDAETQRSLLGHNWAGNARELRNVVESTLAVGGLDLGEAPGPESEARPADAPSLRPYREARSAAVGAFERSYLGALIERCEGNASEAARQAKMDRAYLVGLLKKHGLR